MAVVTLLLAVALAAVAYVQSRQYLLLNVAVQYEDDYLTISLYQLETEFLRLQREWTEQLAGPAPIDREALQLRYDILVSRVGLLETERAARAMVDATSYEQTQQRLHQFIGQADAVLGASPTVPLSPGALRALKPELDALAQPVHSLSLEASHHVAAQVAQRHLAVRRHNQIGIALTALLSVTTLVFALISLRQMRQLDDRRRGLELLAGNLREARREAEAASRAKSAFLANMSHEIRTPFQGLLGMLALLRDTGLNAQQLEHLRTATESADHLLVILNDILDLSKLEAGTLTLAPEPVSLRRLVRDVEALMRPPAMAKGLALRIDLDDTLPEHVMADPTRVKQVLFNLMSNGIKFSDAGSVTLNVRRGDGRLEFVVADTGIGIDEATLARLFQRFTQADETRSRRHGGTGLGLEISRNLARLMGGDIEVVSASGAGSTFTFWMPLVRAAAPSAAICESSSLAVPQRALHVLVAEDHPVNRRYLAALLDRLGHHATFVDNGAKAVQAAAENTFDIVLMDLHMPVMDGVVAAQHIRALGGTLAQVPIVTLSADVFAETRERCLAAGMNDFLSKPVSLQDLATLFARHFAAMRAAPGAETDARANHAVLDVAVIDEVRSLMPRERLAALLEGFLQDAAATAQRMRDAFAHGLADEVRSAAHRTKGAALNLGFNALAEAAQQLHQSALADVAQVDVLLTGFEQRLAESRASAQRAGLLTDAGSVSAVAP